MRAPVAVGARSSKLLSREEPSERERDDDLFFLFLLLDMSLFTKTA